MTDTNYFEETNQIGITIPEPNPEHQMKQQTTSIMTIPGRHGDAPLHEQKPY